jgi:integrase
MDGMRPPYVPEKAVPVFTGEDLSRLERACAGRSFQQRREAAVIAVFRATGIRLSELAQIRYDRQDPRYTDIDLELREITVHGKGHKTRTVKISFGAARSVDRYIRARARHAQAYRPQLWLAVGNRGPMTASGIYPDGAASAASMCSRTGSGITSAIPGKWAELHLMHHSADPVNASCLRRCVRPWGAVVLPSGPAAAVTCDVIGC